VVAAEDTPASKPAPDPYLRAVALLAAAVDDRLDCARVRGDRGSRWASNRRAGGLRTVAVTSSYEAGELGAADLVIPSLARWTARIGAALS